MPRDTSQGNSKEKGAPSSTEKSIGKASEYEHTKKLRNSLGFYYRNSAKFDIGYKNEISPTVKTDSSIATVCEESGNYPTKCYDVGNSRLRNPSEFNEICPCIMSHGGIGGNNVPAILPLDTSFCMSPDNHSNPQCGHPCHTLSTHSHVPKIAVNYCIAGNTINRKVENGGNGKGILDNISYTLNTVDKHAVYCVATGQGNAEILDNISPTVTAAAGTSGNNQPWIMEMSHSDEGLRDCGSISPTLNARMGTGGNQVPFVINGNICNTITSTDYKGPQCVLNPIYSLDRASFNQGKNALYNFKITDDNKTSAIVSKGPSAVYDTEKTSYIRRITPLECERLQGFPDLWTALNKKECLTEKELEFWSNVYKNHKEFIGKPSPGGKILTKNFILKWYNKLDSDSARYKAIGNSVAVPCVSFIMRRIKKVGYNHTGERKNDNKL